MYLTLLYKKWQDSVTSIKPNYLACVHSTDFKSDAAGGANTVKIVYNKTTIQFK